MPYFSTASKDNDSPYKWSAGQSAGGSTPEYTIESYSTRRGYADSLAEMLNARSPGDFDKAYYQAEEAYKRLEASYGGVKPKSKSVEY